MARVKEQKREQLINDYPKKRLFIEPKETQSSVLAKGQRNPLEATFISSTVSLGLTELILDH